MAEPVTFKIQEGVAIIAITHPPVNALSRAVRVALMDAVDRAEEEDSVQEIVLIGGGTTFPAGAELAEFRAGFSEPSMRDLCDRIDFVEKPVVAALHGSVFGAGLELALAAHYRVAAPGARFSLPEIRLGMPPCAGGSQRLPRFVGSEAALRMLLDAQIVTSDHEVWQALVDATAETGTLTDAAVAFCHDVRAKGDALRRSSEETKGFRDPMAYQAAIQASASRRSPTPESPEGRIHALVEAAALLPFEAGLEMETDAFEACRTSPETEGLIHAFVAERAARRFAPAAHLGRPALERLCVLGHGLLGARLVHAALSAGITVGWGVTDPDRRREASGQLRQLMQRAEREGRVDPAARAHHVARLTLGTMDEAIDQPEMIVYAGPGEANAEWSVPASVVRAFALPGQISGLGLRFPTALAEDALVEVIQGPDGTAEQLAMALSLAAKLSKLPVHVRSTGDSLYARLSGALHRAADALVDLGATPYAVDAALQDWGIKAGPFRLRDRYGLAEFADAPRFEAARNWSRVLLEDGRKGESSGQGFYQWVNGMPKPDKAAVGARIDAMRQPQDHSADAIVDLILGAMANEGIRLLREGMAQRGSDIDVVTCVALGFPRVRGGLMKAVSQTGLFRIQKRMERIGHPDTEFWRPEPEWTDLVKNGRTFEGL